MNAEDIRYVLKAIGSEKVKTGAQWVRASCPFALKRHAKSRDREPSFAIRIAPNDLSFFRCQACNIVGPMYGGANDFLWKLREVMGESYPHLGVFLQQTNQPSAERIQARIEAAVPFQSEPKEVAGITVSARLAAQVEMFEKIDATQGIPEDDFRPMMGLPDEAVDYLHGPKRNLTDGTIALFGYGFAKPVRRIAVPQRDCKGRLVNISGRSIEKYAKPPWLHASGFRKELYLYGEDKIDFAWKVCYLVEGMFDVAGLRQKGYVNVLAMLGAYISDFQIEKVKKWFDEVVIVRDGDAPGLQGAQATQAQLLKHMRYGARIVPTLEGKDPDELPLDFLIEHLGPPQVSPT